MYEVISKLKRESTLLTLFLNIVTFGIYGAHYLQGQTSVLNESLQEEDRLDPQIMWGIVAAAWISGILDFVGILQTLSPDFEFLSSAVGLGVSIAYILWSFKWRKMFYAATKTGNVYPQQLNGFLLFLFGIYYINYRVNAMNDTIAAQQGK